MWPHDNAIIAAGMKRYGFDDHALRLFSAVVEAATHFDEYRLPELFCGFSSSEFRVPVRYPVACHPQAWAAASVPWLLHTALGIAANGLERCLRVFRPKLPDFIERLQIRVCPSVTRERAFLSSGVATAASACMCSTFPATSR